MAHYPACKGDPKSIERQDLHAEPESPLLNYPTTARSELDRDLMATALAQASIASVRVDLREAHVQ